MDSALKLAIIQTKYVIEKLEEAYHGKFEFVIITMDTLGDQVLDKPLPKIGEKSLFTRELENALEANEVDFVVHSLKDLPTILPDGKVIGTVLKREDPSDCLILDANHRHLTFETLPAGSIIGTSSLRRGAQIRSKFPHLEIKSIRGNVNTRLRKLDEGLFHGVVLAVSGIKRMHLTDRITEILDRKQFMYAVGQGALAVECLATRTDVVSMLEALSDNETTVAVAAERSFLRMLEGGCSAPVAVNCSYHSDEIILTGLISSLDGNKSVIGTKSRILSKSDNDVEGIGSGSGEPTRKRIRYDFEDCCGIIPNGKILSSELKAAKELGEDLAMYMIDKGVLSIMEEARKEVNVPNS